MIRAILIALTLIPAAYAQESIPAHRTAALISTASGKAAGARLWSGLPSWTDQP